MVDTVTCLVSLPNVNAPSARMSARANGETKRSNPIHFFIVILFMLASPAVLAAARSLRVIVVSVVPVGAVLADAAAQWLDPEAAS